MKKIYYIIFFLFALMSVNAQCWQTVSGGWGHSVGIKSDGTMWAWGENSGSSLGVGSTFSIVPSPLQVGTMGNWLTVSAGQGFNMAIQSNGTLWGWGGNGDGQLGLGTNNPVYVIPTQVGIGTNWQSVDAANRATFAIKTNGTLWAWGDNTSGVLGDGTIINRNFPIQIGADTDWQVMSIGIQTYAMAIKTNGTLWVWGTGTTQMGLGPGGSVNILPTQIGSDTDWQSVSEGANHSIALKTNGTLWSWGNNNIGQLGNGTNTPVNIPTQIGNSNNWQSIYTNGNHNIAQKTDGTIWAWGDNMNGELGNGTTISSNIPIQVGIVNTWQTIATGLSHSLAIKTDGTLWTWGWNAFSQLGDGTQIESHVPIEILSVNVLANATSTTICSGTGLTLNGSGATTYTWSNGVSNGVSFVPPASAIYTVTGTDAIGCYNTATVGITVNPYTSVTANATATTICAGGTVTLTGSGTTNYTWSGNVINGQSFSPVGTATYTVTDTTGCSNTASITVNVIALPTVSVNNATSCSGNTAVLTASATPIAGTTYSWSTGSVGNSLSVNPTTTTFYTVTATNTGCDASAITSVSVTPVVMPITGFSYASPLCLTATNPLPMPVSGFSASGTYFTGAGLTINATTGLIDLGSSNAGTYIITYSIAANGCNPSGNSTFTLTLDAPTVPITNFSYASPFCQNDVNPSPLLASNFINGGTFNSAGLTINATNGTIDLASSTAGTYTISYQVNAANCVQAGTSTTTVVINSNPTLSTSSSTVIITGAQTILTASSSANSYTWFPTTNLSCTNCANPTASPNVTTNYCVQTTDGVCTNSACINVIVESLCEHDKGLYLPNAFSPNGDGNNDVFCVQGETKCTTDFKMLIFDRWGEKVFESTVITFCWDGTYKSKVLNPDVYVYYITAINKDQEKITKKGNVTLIK